MSSSTNRSSYALLGAFREFNTVRHSDVLRLVSATQPRSGAESPPEVWSSGSWLAGKLDSSARLRYQCRVSKFANQVIAVIGSTRD